MTYQTFQTKFGLHLNHQQQLAVQAVEGRVLLLAVPGSGKTTVLVTRLGYMRYGHGIDPSKILTMTYTVTGTADIRARFAHIFGQEQAKYFEFRTINSLCWEIIRYYERVKGQKAFTLITEQNHLTDIIRNSFRAIGKDFATDANLKEIRTAIGYAKNYIFSREQIKALDQKIEGFSTFYQIYTDTLLQRGWMDFDDQMVYAWHILRKYPDILSAFQQRYSYFCVDEAQDISLLQHKIIELLVGKRGNLFMVGDEDQSIYGFRAAYPQALLRFHKLYPEAKLLLMERNYRCTGNIVDMANRVIQYNQSRWNKTMRTTRTAGKAVHDIMLEERKNQYPYLAQVAKHATGTTAFLYRDNDSAVPLVDILERNDIAYRMRPQEGSFFSNRTVQDISDYLRFSLDPSDAAIFMRLYYKWSAGISKVAAQTAIKRARTGQSLLTVLMQDASLSPWTMTRCRALRTHFSALATERGDRGIARILHDMGYREYAKYHDRVDNNTVHLMQVLGRYVSSASRFLDRLDELKSIVKRGKNGEGNAVYLSTIHSSKGLEYERVYVMDVVDTILPRSTDIKQELEEERRLFYVAMTRAKNELSIFTFRKKDEHSSFAQILFPQLPSHQPQNRPTRARYGKEQTQLHGAAPMPTTRYTAEQLKVGCKLQHRYLGQGTIVGKNRCYLTVVFADGRTRNISFAALNHSELFIL